MNRSFCAACSEKQQKIDRLTEEVERLRQALRYQQRKEKEGFFGSSTPSSKLPIKANTPEEQEQKRRGAKPGHKGVGRKSFDDTQADRVVEVQSETAEVCPDCGGPLRDKGGEDPPGDRNLPRQTPTGTVPLSPKVLPPLPAHLSHSCAFGVAQKFIR